MSTVDEYLEQIEALDTLPKIGICIGLMVLTLAFCKYFILRPFRNLVTRSKAQWDDALILPLSNRLYFFVVVAGLQLSGVWVTDSNSELLESLYPYFSVIYIMTTTSILSTGIKHLVPVILGRFTAKSSVTVSGGNPLIVFMLRAVTYFIGLNLALNELNIELLGLFASLAVFSLIIGLAVQQTLGNIVNSFMIAVDRAFEVGDRIEVEGMIGTVISMGILSTKVLDRDEKLVVIPNNSLISSTLVNHARGGGDGIAGDAGGHAARAPEDGGHADAAFEGGDFAATQRPGRTAVIVRQPAVGEALVFDQPRAVITGEEYVGAIGQFEFNKRVEDAADIEIDLLNHVAV